jgi:hypothetical protein
MASQAYSVMKHVLPVVITLAHKMGHALLVTMGTRVLNATKYVLHIVMVKSVIKMERVPV